MTNKMDFIFEDGTIIAYQGHETIVKVPEKINDKVVTKIGEEAFCVKLGICKKEHEPRRLIQEIHLPSTINEIGNRAFYGCISLNQVTLPEKIKVIPEEAFFGCNQLVNIRITNCVTEIGNGAFRKCTSLEKISLPDSVVRVGKQAFRNCDSLKEVMDGQHIENIGDYAFWCCREMEKIPALSMLKELGEGAFAGCDKLKEIDVPTSIVEFKPWTAGEIKHDGKYDSDHTALLVRGVPLKQIKPAKWKHRAARGFLILKSRGESLSPGLEKEYITYLKKNAAEFYNEAMCNKSMLITLIRLNCIPNADVEVILQRIEAIGDVELKLAMLEYSRNLSKPDDFDIRKLEKLSSPSSLKKIWSTKEREDGTLEITSYKGKDTVVEIPAIIGDKLVTRIGNEAFCPYAKRINEVQANIRKTIQKVVIPEGVKEIGFQAFFGCLQLEEVSLPTSVTNIEVEAFELTKIKIME